MIPGIEKDYEMFCQNQHHIHVQHFYMDFKGRYSIFIYPYDLCVSKFVHEVFVNVTDL